MGIDQRQRSGARGMEVGGAVVADWWLVTGLAPAPASASAVYVDLLVRRTVESDD